MIYNLSLLHRDMYFFPPHSPHQYTEQSVLLVDSLKRLNIMLNVPVNKSCIPPNPTTCAMIFQLYYPAVKWPICPALPPAALQSGFPCCPQDPLQKTPLIHCAPILSRLHCVKMSHGPLKQHPCSKMLHQSNTTGVLNWLQEFYFYKIMSNVSFIAHICVHYVLGIHERQWNVKSPFVL